MSDINCFLSTGGALGQQQPINVGEVMHNLLFPSHELMGGLERVLDKAQDLDTQHLSCGKRQVGLSLAKSNSNALTSDHFSC